MSAPLRPALDRVTNLPENIRQGLEQVATKGVVNVPLAEYNQIVDRLAILERYLPQRMREIDTVMESLNTRVTSLEANLRVCFSLTADQAAREEQLRLRWANGGLNDFIFAYLKGEING